MHGDAVIGANVGLQPSMDGDGPYGKYRPHNGIQRNCLQCGDGLGVETTLTQRRQGGVGGTGLQIDKQVRK